MRAAAAVRALAEASLRQVAGAVASDSVRGSAPSNEDAPREKRVVDRVMNEALPGAVSDRAATQDTVDESSADMEAEAGPQNPSRASVATSTALWAHASPPEQAVSPAVTTTEAGSGVRAGTESGGTAEVAQYESAHEEPAPLLDGRPPERSWLPLRGSRAGRVDLYRVKKLC